MSVDMQQWWKRRPELYDGNLLCRLLQVFRYEAHLLRNAEVALVRHKRRVREEDTKLAMASSKSKSAFLVPRERNPTGSEDLRRSGFPQAQPFVWCWETWERTQNSIS